MRQLKRILEKKRFNQSISFILLTTILISLAQIIYKYGIVKVNFDASFFSNPHTLFLVLGIIIYASGAVLLLLALKKGEVSVLYPILGTTYIWVALLSRWLFGESITLMKTSGILVIIIGVVFIAMGSEAVKDKKVKDKKVKDKKVKDGVLA